MAVRGEKRRDPKTGAVREMWMIDILYQHPDGRRERVRKVSPVSTRRGAEEYERQLRQSLLSGTFGKKEGTREIPTLEKFADEFITTYAVANNKPSEVQTKKSTLKVNLLPALGKRRLDEIGLREIETYKSRKLKEGLSPKSINNHLTVLRRILALAVEWELIGHIPQVKWLRVPEPEFDFLTFEEADRLVAAADGEWAAMIAVAGKTGLRLGELLALRWDDVDLVVGRLVVRRSVAREIVGTPKSGRSREIPLGAEVLRVLKGQRDLRGELVFCTEDGKMFTKGECKWPMRRACRKAGLREIGWHVLRHTFASQLVARGAPLKAVQELMGHAPIEMTMRYSHLSPDVRRDAVRLLDNGNLMATEQGGMSKSVNLQ